MKTLTENRKAESGNRKCNRMAGYIIAALLFLTLFALCANAQQAAPAATDFNTPLPLAGGLTNEPSYLQKAKIAAKDLYALAAPVIPNWKNYDYKLAIGVGRNFASGESIEAGMLSCVNTNGTGISLIGGRLGSKWVYGGGTFSLGRTNHVPILGAVHEAIGDGVIYDWDTHDVANYAFVLLEKDWRIDAHFAVGAGVMIANRSNRSGVDGIAGANVSYTH